MWMRAAILVVGVAAVMAAGAWHEVQRTRVIEGAWLYMFEGSNFFEQRLAGQECELSRDDESWLNYDIRQVYPRYGDERRSYPSTGTYRTHYGEWPMEAFEVRFEGRRNLTPWGSGHLGMSKSEYDVERMLSVKPIPDLTCTVR
jgi:hypothetical protein